MQLNSIRKPTIPPLLAVLYWHPLPLLARSLPPPFHDRPLSRLPPFALPHHIIRHLLLQPSPHGVFPLLSLWNIPLEFPLVMTLQRATPSGGLDDKHILASLNRQNVYRLS